MHISSRGVKTDGNTVTVTHSVDLHLSALIYKDNFNLYT